jgi:hypothetical protein
VEPPSPLEVPPAPPALVVVDEDDDEVVGSPPVPVAAVGWPPAPEPVAVTLSPPAHAATQHEMTNAR